MKKQILIVGLGRLGIPLAEALFEMGHDILAIDTDEKQVREAAGHITHAVQADATSETVLRELGASNFDMAIVTTGSEVEASVLATILLKKLGVPRIIARANSELHGAILDKIGADTVVYPEKEMGLRIAREIEMEGITDYIPLGEKSGIAKIEVPDAFIGKRIEELGFSQHGRNLIILLIQRNTAPGRTEESIINPDAQETILAGDNLVFAGDISGLEHILTENRKNGLKGNWQIF